MSTQYTTNDVARFWSKVDKSGDCWLWIASKNTSGDVHFARRHTALIVRGEQHGRARVTEEHVCEIRQRRAQGETITSLATTFHIGIGTVFHIINRDTWKHSD